MRCSLDLMGSYNLVLDADDSMKVANANTTNTSDAMDDVGDVIFPM